MGSIMLNGISYTSSGADVEANPQDTPSDTLSTIGIDGVVYEIEGGGGGSDVVVNPTITSGTKIADITVDGDTSSLYAPEVSLTYAEYMALTEQEKNNGTTYYITDMDAGSINIFTPVIYSKYERKIGVWIDDKPLYARTIIHTGALNSVSDWTLYDDSVSYDMLVRANVTRINTNGEVTPNANTFENSPRFNTKADHKLYYYSQYAITATYIYITLLYTKTTDTAGSGSYNTLGVPMVHIEDDVEYIIGTYNGETLYRKRYKFTNPSAGDQMHPYNITGSIKEIVNFYGVWHRDMTSVGNGLWAYQINAENEISTQDQFRVLARPRKENGVEGIYTYYPTSGAYSGAVADICITIEYTKVSS